MAIDYERLLNRRFQPVRHAYSTRDTMLYALGVGLGADPLDVDQLRFVYEGERGPDILPTLPAILAYPGFWAREPDTGIDWKRLVHAEQSFENHSPLAAQGEVIGQNRITSIHDKGAAKGALLTQERTIIDAASNVKLATVTQVSLLRGDGGFGGPAQSAPPAPHALPERAPDAVCDLPTLPQAALIYRLSGDFNPLHADPAVARAVGFDRPILHGLCTMGVACHAVLRSMLAYDAIRVRSMRVRFTAPVLPGDVLRTELWQDGNVISFRTLVPERGVVALNAGRIETAP